MDESGAKKQKGRRYAAKLCALFLVLMLLSGCGKSADALRQEGIALIASGSYAEAITKLDEALDAGKGKVGALQYDILLYRAEAEYMNGDYAAAKHTYELLIEADGEKEPYTSLLNQANAKLLLADATKALDDNDTETARSLLDQVKSLGLLSDHDLEFDEGVYLEKTAQWEDAYNAFLALNGKYPDDAAAKKELDFLKTRVGK